MSITPSLIPQIASGPAPLAVYVDCKGTVSTQTSRPFHDCLYLIDWGDPGSGNYAYGMQISRERSEGPIAAHVYETIGTKIITLTVFDGVDIVKTTTQITVTDPDVVFSGSTLVISHDGDFTNAPAGTQATDTDYDNIINVRAGNGATFKRIRLKRGGTYTTSALPVIDSDGPGLVDTWGSGAKPIVSGTSSPTYGNSTNHDFGNWRVVDIDFRSSSNTGDGVNFAGGVSNLLLLRCDWLDFFSAISEEPGFGGSLDDINTPTKVVDLWNGICWADCTYTSGDAGFLAAIDRLMVLGTRFGPIVNGGGHVFRVAHSRGHILSSSEFDGTGGPGLPLTIRAKPDGPTYGSDTWTEYGVVSDCKMIGGTGSVAPIRYMISAGEGGRLRNLITERNWVVLSSTMSSGVNCQTQNHSIRNNLIDGTLHTGFMTGVVLGQDASHPADYQTEFDIYNNTLFSNASSSSGATQLSVSGSPTNVRMKNNLAWLDLNTGTMTVTSGSLGSGSDISDNSTVGQMNGTDPSFVTASGPRDQPAEFQIQDGSYAEENGASVKVFRDFFGRSRRGVANDMGIHQFNEGLAIVALDDSLPAPNVTRRSQKIWAYR